MGVRIAQKDTKNKLPISPRFGQFVEQKYSINNNSFILRFYAHFVTLGLKFNKPVIAR